MYVVFVSHMRQLARATVPITSHQVRSFLSVALLLLLPALKEDAATG
jgi:hypothetical protein